MIFLRKGQLGVAQTVLEELDIATVETISLAKGRELKDENLHERDHVYLPGRKTSPVTNTFCIGPSGPSSSGPKANERGR